MNYYYYYSPSDLLYVTVTKAYPQHAYVSTFCPSGYAYSRHVCGTGAPTWLGVGVVQYGPFTKDEYIAGDGGHCSCCCNCQSVRVECKPAGDFFSSNSRGDPVDPHYQIFGR